MKKPILFIFTIICLPILADAHHSTAANFTQEIISIKGVIESVRSVNPHSSILIKNTDDEGEITIWLIETTSRTTLNRQGVSLDVMEVGSEITATGRKGRREYTMYLQKISFEDGSEFFPRQDRD